MFPKFPQSSLGILSVPQEHPLPLNTPPPPQEPPEGFLRGVARVDFVESHFSGILSTWTNDGLVIYYPIGSMYGIFPYIYHKI